MQFSNFSRLSLITCLLLLTSCLTGTDQEDSPSQYALNFNLANVSSELTVGEETIRITEVSFIQGPIALYSASGDSASLFSGRGIFNYQFPASESQRLLLGELEGGTYGNLTYDIVKADPNDENIPGPFVDGEEEDQLYSMIIAGEIDTTSFTYKSARAFDFDFNLGSPLDIPQNNTSLTLAVQFNIHDVFVKQDSSGFLDPTDPDNAQQINDNIQNAIQLLPFE